MTDILGKELDTFEDSLATREPFNLKESDVDGAQFMTGTDFVRSAKINPEWKVPVALPTQATGEKYKIAQPFISAGTALSDVIANYLPNIENLGAQYALEMTGEREKSETPVEKLVKGTEFGSLYHDVAKILGMTMIGFDMVQNRKEYQERAKTYDDTVELLNNRDYPLTKYAHRILASTTDDVETRKIVRELYNQSQGIDSSAWYNQAGSIIGAMIPTLTFAKGAGSAARAFGASRIGAVSTAQNVAKAFIGGQMAGEYAEETAAEYIKRTGDKTFENFTAKDANGLSAAAYGAIGAQIEFIGGVEPIMAGALSKVGLRSGGIKAAIKIGTGEATEEFLQGITETLMRKIDNTSNKTWAEGIKESLNGAVWGLFIGGTIGTGAFYTNRRNLVKGIKTSIPNISDTQAQLIADAMIDSVAENSSQDPTLRNNLRQKVSMIYRDIDIDNKDDVIDATTDLEYSLIASDAAERGISIAEHEIFGGEVNELGWFRKGIPEERRTEIQQLNDEIKNIKDQLAQETKKEEKNWEKIDELENKLAQANQYIIDKISDLARADARAVKNILRKTEKNFVEREKETATKKAIIHGNVDIIRDILSKNNFRTRELSGTKVKELAKMNWPLFTGQYLGESQRRGSTQVKLSDIEANVESGNDVLKRAGFTQAEIDKMDDITWNNAILVQYRKEREEQNIDKEPEMTPEEAEQFLKDTEGIDWQDLADENARLDDIYPAYDGDTIRIIDPAELKQAQYEVIQRTNPMQDDYHVGIRSVEDIKTFDETINDKDSFVWGDYSQEDAKRDLAKNEITIYSSKPIENGVFVSTSYRQAQEYAGGKGAKVYKKTVPLDYVAWISGDEGQFAITDVVGKKRTVYNSNGERIAKSEPALRNFYKWFGDSKVVDEQGRPLVVYHGTNAEFSKFDKRRQRKQEGRTGFWFSNIENDFGTSVNGNKIVMPLYLSLKNPYIVNAKGSNWYDIEVDPEIYPGIHEAAFGYRFQGKTANTDMLSAYAKKAGYDGLIVNNVIEGDYAGAVERQMVNDYVAFEPNQIKSVDNRGTFSADTGNIYWQPGYASMRGDLIGGALDADAFEGKGEGTSVWAWGNYLLKSRELDKAHYFDSFNRQGAPRILYDGHKISDMFMTDYAQTEVIRDLIDEKSKEEILAELEKTLNARKNEVERKTDYIYTRLENKIPRHKLSEIIQDVYKLIDMGGVFYTKYPEGSIAADIQKKYKPQGENPEGKRFTEEFLSVVDAVALSYGGLDNANILRDSIKDLTVDIDIFKGMDFKKLSGLTGFTYKGEPILKPIREQIAKHLDPTSRSYLVSEVEKQASEVLRDAVIKNRDIGEALAKAADEAEKNLMADAEKYKKRLLDTNDFTKEQKKVLDDIFAEITVGGSMALDDKSRLKIHKIADGKYTFNDQGKESWKINADLYNKFGFAFKSFESGAQKAKALREVANFFKNAKQKDFVLKSRASMYRFDVPSDRYLLDFTKTIENQSKYVINALNKLYDETHIGDRPSLRIVKSKNLEALPRYRRPQDITDNPNYDHIYNTVLDYDKELDAFILDWNDKGLKYAKNKLDSEIDRDEKTIQVFKDTLKEKQEDLAKEEKYSDEYLRIEKAITSAENNISNLEERLEPKRAVKRNADKIPDNAKFSDYAEVEYEPDYHMKGYEYYQSIENSFRIGQEEEKKLAKSLGAIDKHGNIHAQKAASKLLEKYGLKGVKYYGNRDKTGFVTFGRTEPIERLLQNRVSGGAPSTYRGAYIPQYRFVMRANNMDASTLSHELAHDWFEVNMARYRSGEATEDFMKAWGALEKALGIEEGSKTSIRKASETFARAYEAWIVSNEDWAKLLAVEDKDKDAIEKLLKRYQGELRDIYNDINNPYFKNTWGNIGELKPELKEWFNKVVNITDLDVMAERGEITKDQAKEEKTNRAIDQIIETTIDEETSTAIKEAKILNDTSRYEVEGGNKNALQERLANLARDIDENNMLLKAQKYDTRRDMIQVAEAADNFVKTRTNDALAIINGEMAEVEGLYKEDIYTALERMAVETGDLGLIDELKASEIANRLAKELGQRVAGFRNWKQSTDLDVVSAIKSLDNKFAQALENKKAQKEFDYALNMLNDSIKQQDKIADKQLEATLKELECK